MLWYFGEECGDFIHIWYSYQVPCVVAHGYIIAFGSVLNFSNCVHFFINFEYLLWYLREEELLNSSLLEIPTKLKSCMVYALVKACYICTLYIFYIQYLAIIRLTTCNSFIHNIGCAIKTNERMMFIECNINSHSVQWRLIVFAIVVNIYNRIQFFIIKFCKWFLKFLTVSCRMKEV